MKEKSCKYKECNRKNWDEKHCIFHSRNENKSKNFKDEFWKEFQKQNSSDNEELNFKGFIFPNDISFERKSIEKDLSFEDAKFLGEPEFFEVEFKKKVNFSDSQFLSGANFLNTEFLGEAIFSGSDFEGEAIFSYSRFLDRANFANVKFSDEINFDNVKFLNVATFLETDFFSKANFSEARFIKKALFFQSDFNEEVVFSNAYFNGEACFRVSHFFKKADFEKSHFLGQASFKNATFDGKSVFSNSHFSSKAFFDKCEFKEIKKLRMKDTFFFDVYGLINYLKNAMKSNEISPYRISYGNTNIFNRIPLIFKNELTEFVSPNIRLILGENSKARNPIISRKISDDYFLLKNNKENPCFTRFWLVFADCGRSFERWASWSLAFIVLFSLIFANYSVLPFLPEPIQTFLTSIDPKFDFHSNRDFFTPFYFSVVTFTTLGFGDVLPTNLAGEIWVVLEVIIGHFMLGGLISIFSNKLFRRS